MFKFPQGNNAAHELHAIIGGQFKAAGEFFALTFIDLDDSVAAGAGVIAGAAIGVNRHFAGFGGGVCN